MFLQTIDARYERDRTCSQNYNVGVDLVFGAKWCSLGTGKHGIDRTIKSLSKL